MSKRHQYNVNDKTLADLAPISISIDEETALCTVSGVSYDMMRTIFNEAFLYQSENKFKTVEIDPASGLIETKKANAEDSQNWHFIMRDVVDHLGWVMGNAIQGRSPVQPPVVDKREDRDWHRERTPAWVLKSTEPEQMVEASAVDPVVAAQIAALEAARKSFNENIDAQLAKLKKDI